MTAHRHRLFRAVAGRVNELEKLNRKKTYETLLFGDGSGTVHVSLASVFTFQPDTLIFLLRLLQSPKPSPALIRIVLAFWLPHTRMIFFTNS